MIGRTAHELFPREQADALLEQDQRLLEDTKQHSFEDWFTFPDGHRELMHLERNALRASAASRSGSS